MIPLRQSTASQEIPLGYFLDSTDGDTAETALTINNTDIKLWKAGATTLASKNSGGATHIAGGVYYAVLDATDTNTVGPLVIFVHVSGALTVRLECVVYAANVYDSLIAGSDYLQADAMQIEGSDATTQITASVPTAAAIRTEVDSNSTQLAAIVADTNELQTDDIPGAIAALNDPTAAAIAAAVRDVSNATPAVGSLGENLANVLADTADMQPKLGTPAADISADIAAVKVDTAAVLDDTGTNGVLVATGGIPATAFAAGAIDAAALASDAGAELADAFLDRDMSTGADSGSSTVRTVRQALRFMRNKWSIAGGTLTVCKENDVTASWTAAVGTTAGDPTSSVDPAG